MRLFSILFVTLFIGAGCANERAASTRHTRKEIVQIAIAFAKKSGRDLDGFRAPQVWDYEPRFGWWVMFREKPPENPGGDMIVSVDDSSGVAQFIPTR